MEVACSCCLATVLALHDLGGTILDRPKMFFEITLAKLQKLHPQKCRGSKAVLQQHRFENPMIIQSLCSAPIDRVVGTRFVVPIRLLLESKSDQDGWMDQVSDSTSLNTVQPQNRPPVSSG